MSTDKNRLLLEIEQVIRTANKDAINPVIDELSVEGLRPVMNMVASSRAEYLRELCDLADLCQNNAPTPEHINKLRNLRQVYEELLKGAQALEAAIDRGYLDIKSNSI
jgi:hypothetical protein